MNIVKVYTCLEYEPHEGGSVEAVFFSKYEAIKFVRNKLSGQGEITQEEQQPDQYIDRYSIYISAEKEFLKWKIEEWELEK